MKRLLPLLCCLLILSGFWASAAAPEGLKSETAVLMDFETGQVLYDKDMAQQIYPASTTKVLTAIVVLENASLYELMTVQESAFEGITYDSSHIWLVEGEEFTVENGLYALMLYSANDAANVLAEHVGGSLEEFAAMMNAKAAEIGALNSNFTNAHGLHDDNHYTTAYDMALITRYAMQNETFLEIFGTDRYTMPETNVNDERPFTNYQYQLVRETGYYNPDVVGGKVGYTTLAQHTMTTGARRGGRTLVCTVMGSPSRGDKFADTDSLLDFGFEEFSSFYLPRERYGGFEAPVHEGEEAVGRVEFTAGRDFSALLHNSIDPSQVEVIFHRPDFYTVDGPFSCQVTFEAAESPDWVPALLGSIDLKSVPHLPMEEVLEAGREHSLVVRVLIRIAIIAGSLLILLLLLIAIRRLQIRRRRRARQRRLERKRREAEQQPAGYRPPPSRTTAASRSSSDYSSRMGAE